MSFDVFLPGGVFVGRALLSFAKFGTDADLCFELADENNDVGGKLIVRVEPHPAEEKVAEVVESDPVPTPKAADPPVVEREAGPKTRLSVSKVHLLGTDPFICTLKVGANHKVCDTSGSEEYLFDLHPEEDVVVEVHTGGKLYGSAKLKGATVLARSGTNNWVLLSSPAGPHVGKLLLTVSSVVPLQTADGLLGSAGTELIELGVVVVSADGLPHPCNACVYLSIGDNDRATTKKADTASPAWGETFSFFVEEDETLSAKLFDNEDFVAEAIVPVAELLYVASVQRELEIKLLDRKRRNAGLLVLGAQVTNGRPSVPVAKAAPSVINASPASATVPSVPSVPGAVAQRVIRIPLGAPLPPPPPVAGIFREYPVRREVLSGSILPPSASVLSGGFVPSPAVVHLGQTTAVTPAGQYAPTIPGATVRYGGRIRLGHTAPLFVESNVVASRARIPSGAGSLTRTVPSGASSLTRTPQRGSARSRTAVA
eukprot:EG_transcript_7104